MKRKLFTMLCLLVLAFFASASGTAGQEGPGNSAAASQAPASVEGTVAASISYQGVLREGGSPVTGTRNMIFRFFDNSRCSGTNIYAIAKGAVPVTNGLFSVAVDVNPIFFDGRGLWLRVEVGGTGIGCQAILNAPYALSLRPGATISGGGTVLNLNSTTGTTLQATTSTTAGGTVAAISGKSTATSGGKAAIDGEIASKSDWTIGVWGRATGTSGVTSGVWGQTESTSNGARGVTGWAHGASGATVGVRGDSQSPAGTGVAGYANAATGSTYGVYGETVSRSDWTVAVWGNARGQSGVTTGVWGTTNSSTNGSRGVMGMASATAGETYGVVGENASPSGWAAAFNSSGNGVWIGTAKGREALGVNLGDVVVDEGNLVVGGTKSAVVNTQDGSRLLYTEESTEVWFTDYGFGKLVSGTAQVAIDPIFAQTVNLAEPYHVFVQVYGDADVYVTDRTATGFEVHLRGGDPKTEFSYRVVAKRLGFEGQRLERTSWGTDAAALHPTMQGTAPIPMAESATDETTQ